MAKKKAQAERPSDDGADPARRNGAASPTTTRASKASVKAGTKDSGDTHVVTLVHDLGQMIEAARKQVAVAANAALTTLYWQLGQRVRTEVLDGRRAERGAQIVSAVGRLLEARYGRGFSEKSLWHMVRFAQAFPDPEIVSALRRQLSWTHFSSSSSTSRMS